MYRRIELIIPFREEDSTVSDIIGGLCRVGNDEIVEAWVSLNNPRKSINKNVRFYFTEAGWDKYGRNTVAACIRTGQKYRVLAFEEHDVDVFYKDEYQVCLRPKHKRQKNNRGANNL